jgi:hypothetical protein
VVAGLVRPLTVLPGGVADACVVDVLLGSLVLEEPNEDVRIAVRFDQSGLDQGGDAGGGVGLVRDAGDDVRRQRTVRLVLA